MLLFIAGAVVAFVLVEGGAHGSVTAVTGAGAPPAVPVWAHLHLLPAGGAVVLVWAADRAIDDTAAWISAGFVATATYLLLGALQTTVARR